MLYVAATIECLFYWHPFQEWYGTTIGTFWQYTASTILEGQASEEEGQKMAE